MNVAERFGVSRTLIRSCSLRRHERVAGSVVDHLHIILAMEQRDAALVEVLYPNTPTSRRNMSKN